MPATNIATQTSGTVGMMYGKQANTAMPQAEINATTMGASLLPVRVRRSHRMPANSIPVEFIKIVDTPKILPTWPYLAPYARIRSVGTHAATQEPHIDNSATSRQFRP